MPALNRDLNNNSLPDGYTVPLTNFDGTDGVASSGNKSFTSSANNSSFASISNLGGLEKGTNMFKMFTKGQPGDSIRLVLSFPDVNMPSQLVMFGAGTSNWTAQAKPIQVPVNATRVNINFVLIKRNTPGIVKMSGLEMRKSSIPVLNKGYIQQKKVNEDFAPIQLNNWVNDTFYSLNDLSFTVIPNSNHVLVYPNPMLDELNIQLPKMESFKRVRIYDLNAKLYLHFDEKDSNELKIDTSEIPQGVYILECILGNGELPRQLLVK
jgi:hypothetical protein